MLLLQLIATTEGNNPERSHRTVELAERLAKIWQHPLGNECMFSRYGQRGNDVHHKVSSSSHELIRLVCTAEYSNNKAATRIAPHLHVAAGVSNLCHALHILNFQPLHELMDH